MKILTITSNDLGISWGPAIHYLELWNEFASLSPISKITGYAPSWTKAPPIIKTDFNLRTLPVSNIRSFRQITFDLRMFMFLLRNKNKYDIIYLRLSHWHALQILALKIGKTPFVLELNGLAKEDSTSSKKSNLYGKIIALQEKWLVQNASLCITVSDGIAQSIHQKYKPEGDVLTISNGVARQFFTPERTIEEKQSPLTIIYVGTFTSWDGASETVKLAESFPQINFLMVGDGAARKKIESGAPHNVKFLGKISYHKLPGLYKQADGAIVLYEYERHRSVKVSSLKTLEYVASRLPVFTTNIPGQQYIQENEFGLLVEENESLTDAFKRFISNIEHYASSYKHSPEFMYEQFGWKKTAKATVSALTKLIP